MRLFGSAASRDVRTGDIAKRLIDHGFILTAFPFSVSGAMMIEPTPPRRTQSLH
jgi:glycine cleavage system protein P-like pyridoxal-binding family